MGRSEPYGSQTESKGKCNTGYGMVFGCSLALRNLGITHFAISRDPQYGCQYITALLAILADISN
jgi:hypothetical protein